MHRQGNNPGKRPNVSTSEQPVKHQKVGSPMLVQNLLDSNQQIMSLLAKLGQSNSIAAPTTQTTTPNTAQPTTQSNKRPIILNFNPNNDEAFKEKFKIEQEQKKEQLLKMLNQDDPWLRYLVGAVQNEIDKKENKKLGERSKIGRCGTIKVKISPALKNRLENIEPSQKELLGIHKFHVNKKDNHNVEISLHTAKSWLKIILPKINYNDFNSSKVKFVPEYTSRSKPPAKKVTRKKEKKLSLPLELQANIASIPEIDNEKFVMPLDEENTTQFESFDQVIMTAATNSDFQLDSKNTGLLNTTQNEFCEPPQSFYESKLALFSSEKDDLTDEKEEELTTDKVDNSFADSFLTI